jgi:hypothetical protein
MKNEDQLNKLIIHRIGVGECEYQGFKLLQKKYGQ